MTSVGIERLNLYSSRFCTDAVELAVARGKERGYASEQVMVETRAVVPVYEDAVTLAVNAARRLLTPQDTKDIELLVVGTESSVDSGKPVSTWVQRFCELSPNCRNFEVKHACYGGTAALKTALFWVAAGLRPGKKALVVSADCTRSHFGDPNEFLGGGSAVAMLVSANPELLELEPAQAGYWSYEIADTFRPTSKLEVIDSQKSLYAYLDALDGAAAHYQQVVGPVDFVTGFKKHIYHAPFPGMTLQAHRALLQRSGLRKAEVLRSFDEKVREGLHFARRVGTAYGASNFISLLGLLQTAKDLGAGDRVSLFSYGSGCQGEFYHGIVGPRARELVQSLGLDAHLDDRASLPLAMYEVNERLRERYTDLADYEPVRTGESAYDALYERHYAGRGLLVLKQVQGHVRRYELS